MLFEDKKHVPTAPASPVSGRATRLSLPPEVLTALGPLFSSEPLQFSDAASLVTNSDTLREIGNRVGARTIMPHIDRFAKSATLVFRGMMLSPIELRDIVSDGIRLNKISATGRGKINFGIVLDVPILAAFDVPNNVSARDEVLAVLVIAKQSGIPNPKLQHSLLETWEDVPSSAILHILVFDPGKNAFREML